MEEAVLARLTAMLQSGRIDLTSYFRQCAMLGIAFAAAVGAAAGTPAWAESTAAQRAESVTYADFGVADTADFFAADDQACQPSTGTWQANWSSRWSDRAPPPPPSIPDNPFEGT